MVELGKLAQADVDKAMEVTYRGFTEALDYVRRSEVSWVPNAMGGVWIPYRGRSDDAATPEVQTKVPAQTLVDLARRMAQLPSGFSPNAKVAKVWQDRLAKLEGGDTFDWGTGEAMAFASLLAEGHADPPVRPGRAPRHLHATATPCSSTQDGERYSPLQNLGSQQGKFEVWDSALSRAGRARLRLRLLARLPRRARLLGGAVRRLRQRRAGHHRPVHLVGPSGASGGA